MANKTKTMSQIKQLFTLRGQGYMIKPISRVTGIARNTVKHYFHKADQLGLSQDAIALLNDVELETLLNVPQGDQRDNYQDFVSNAPRYVNELKEHKHLTRVVLWEEERKNGSTAYSYSQFCEHLKRYMDSKELTMVMEHIPGDKLFIDFAGDRLMLTDPDSGKLTPCELLLLTLGYSSFTVGVAVKSQKTEDLIDGVVKGLERLGRSPKALVPDNLKAAVIKPHRYDPKINERFLMMANHYGISVLPARPLKPRDKAKVESAVNAFYRQIYGRIRKQQFFSIHQLNTTLFELTDQFNERLMQEHGVSRKLLYERDEKHLMQPLPAAFCLTEQLQLTVQKNYHVQIRSLNQYYSVPYSLAGQKVKVLLTKELVSIYHNGQCVATHAIGGERKYITLKEHMSSSHLHYHQNQDITTLRNRAYGISEEVLTVVDYFLQRNDHPEQGFKSCQGILSLEHKCGAKALIWACKMAIETRCFTYRYITKVAQSPYSDQNTEPSQGPLPPHLNIRGAGYYQ